MRRIVLALAILGQGLTPPVAVCAAAPPPYSLPWHLRPATPARVLRLDSVVADYEDASGHSGSTRAALLLAAAKVGPRAALIGRMGIVNNSPPVGGAATVTTNLLVGGHYAPKPTGDVRVGLYLLMGLPVGGGGGNTPEAAASAAIKSGVPARSGMDNTMFAVNDFVLLPGLDVALVKGGWTVQGEATLFELWRVRGEKKQPDVRRTNFTCGLHVGRFVATRVSLGAEFRYQRWLSTTAAVAADARNRDTASVAFGPRFHLKAGEGKWLRPGVAVGVPLDAPMKSADYLTVQVDLPCTF